MRCVRISISGIRLFVGLTVSAASRSPKSITKPTSTDRSFKVTVQPGGEYFHCDAGQSILVAAHAANILISYSCRSGQCGSCLGRLLVGEVCYPQGLPDALSSEQKEQGYALFCSAYAESDLIIELMQPEFPG